MSWPLYLRSALFTSCQTIRTRQPVNLEASWAHLLDSRADVDIRKSGTHVDGVTGTGLVVVTSGVSVAVVVL
jgi:hypothetical protein